MCLDEVIAGGPATKERAMATDAVSRPGPTPPDDLAAEVARLRAERDALLAQVEGLQRRRRRGGVLRRVAVVVLVVLSCLSLTSATVGVWADRTLLDTDGWIETVGPLGADPAVTAALQARISDGVVEILPAEEIIAEALPDNAAFLAAPLSTAVFDFVDEQVAAFLASEEFQTLWVEVNASTHARVLAVLRGEGEIAQIEGDTVVLDLLPIINRALVRLEGVASQLVGSDVDLPEITSGEVPERARARLSSALDVELPEDFGEIVVYDTDQLATVQRALVLFDQLLVALLVATPVLIIAALWLSTNRRRTLLQLLIGTSVLLVVVRRIAFLVQDHVAGLAPQETGRGAVQALADRVLDGLFGLTEPMLIAAFALIAVALLSAPYPWAVALRRNTVALGRATAEAGGRARQGIDTTGVVAWTQRHLRALQVAGAVVAVLLVAFVDVSWWGLLTVLVLLAAYEVALWRLGGVVVDASPGGITRPG